MGLGWLCFAGCAGSAQTAKRYALESDKSKIFERVWRHGYVDLVGGGVSLWVGCVLQVVQALLKLAPDCVASKKSLAGWVRRFGWRGRGGEAGSWVGCVLQVVYVDLVAGGGAGGSWLCFAGCTGSAQTGYVGICRIYAGM